jgi:hypothetical protein
MMLADGGEAIGDLVLLCGQREVFGQVALRIWSRESA